MIYLTKFRKMFFHIFLVYFNNADLRFNYISCFILDALIFLFEFVTGESQATFQVLIRISEKSQTLLWKEIEL